MRDLIFTHIYVYNHLRTHMHTVIHSCTSTLIQAHAHTYPCTHAHLCFCIHIYTYPFVVIETAKCRYLCTHTQIACGIKVTYSLELNVGIQWIYKINIHSINYYEPVIDLCLIMTIIHVSHLSNSTDMYWWKAFWCSPSAHVFCVLFRGRPRKVVAPAKLVEDPDSDDGLSLDVDTDENEVNSCRNLSNDALKILQISWISLAQKRNNILFFFYLFMCIFCCCLK